VTDAGSGVWKFRRCPKGDWNKHRKRPKLYWPTMSASSRNLGWK
jgi:hypothetical protein